MALQFKPFERGGRAVPVSFDTVIDARVDDYEGPADRVLPPHPDPSSVSMAIRRTGCFGSCPSYRLEMRGDGRVSYWGERDVVVEGEHHWRIDPAAVTRLLAQFRAADYLSLQGYYIVQVSDHPSYVTRLSIGTQRKFVFDYAGAMAGRLAPEEDAPAVQAGAGRMPGSVTQLEDAIDEVAGSASWVRGDERTMERLRQAKWNFRTPAAAHGLSRLIGDCNLPLARAFVEAGAPVNMPGNGVMDDDVPIQRAARCGDLELVRLMVERGALARQEDARDFLLSSAEAGYPELVKLALQHAQPARATTRDDTPVLVAAAHAVNFDDEKSTPLTFNPAGVVQVLLAHGADVHARDREGNTALHEANSEAVARALLAGGADPNARNVKGETPLFNAYQDDAKPALVAAGADLGARNKWGQTALFNQHYRSGAELLLKLGCDLNAQDLEGRTPLEATPDEGVALVFLEAGAKLPADPARMAALIDRARENKWNHLLAALAQRAAAQPATAPQ